MFCKTDLDCKSKCFSRKQFSQAYQDAVDGKIGAQYIDDTPEVKAAKERFHKFFKFVLDGMLIKLSPKPGYNQIPEQIADFYIKEWTLLFQ